MKGIVGVILLLNVALAGCLGGNEAAISNEPVVADEVTIESQNNHYNNTTNENTTNVFQYNGSAEGQLYVLYGFANPSWGVVTTTYPDGTVVNETIEGGPNDFHSFTTINTAANESLKIESAVYSAVVSIDWANNSDTQNYNSWYRTVTTTSIADIQSACYEDNRMNTQIKSYFGGGRECSFTIGGYYTYANTYYSNYFLLDGFTWEIHYRIVPTETGISSP